MNPLEIAVVSGKGGTGKTTVSSALAAALKGDCVLCDADVDVPDLWILLRPRILEREDFMGQEKAEMRRHLCEGCGRCAAACRFDAIWLEDGEVRLDRRRCEGCGACAVVCPTGAISLSPSIQGDVFRSETDLGPFWHARLHPGGENSGRLVQLLRDRARKTGRELGKRWVLVDGPPGVACPAASAITGCQLALAVTEPSRSGLHDLRRLGELASRLRVPMAVVLNRSDLSEEGAQAVRRTCDEMGWPLLAEIPFDQEIARDLAMARIPSAPLAKAIQAIKEGMEDLLGEDAVEEGE